MKKNFLSAMLLFAAIGLFSSCQKRLDPLPEKEPTKTELLTKHQWKADEVLRSLDGSNSHYIRDSINDTGTNYDLLRLSFNADGTGSYVDEVGISHSLNWKFTTTDERNMELTIGQPSATTFVWNIVEISKTSLTNTTPYGPDILVSARYTPVDKVK